MCLLCSNWIYIFLLYSYLIDCMCRFNSSVGVAVTLCLRGFVCPNCELIQRGRKVMQLNI